MVGGEGGVILKTDFNVTKLTKSSIDSDRIEKKKKKISVEAEFVTYLPTTACRDQLLLNCCRVLFC